jgi:hypothetical protein
MTNKKIAPHDIDLVYERNGYFLMLECKHPQDPDLSQGVEISLSKLHNPPYITVIVVRLTGERYETGALKFEPTAWRVIDERTWTSGTLADFRKRVASWEQKVLKSRLTVTSYGEID